MAPERYQDDLPGGAELVTPPEDSRTIREHLAWQLRATRVLNDLLTLAVRDALPRIAWTVGSLGASPAGQCHGRTGADRRRGFEAWCTAVGATPRPEITDFSGETHLRAIVSRYDGLVDIVVLADIYPDRRQRGRPVSASTRDGRCAAAHVADPRPCEGQRDAVRIVDQVGAGTEACLLHGAVLVASFHRGRVYPLNGPNGSAIAVFTRARALPPFDFLTGPSVARVTTVNEAAVFPSASELAEPEGGPSRSHNVGDGGDDAQDRDGNGGQPFGVERPDVSGGGSAAAQSRSRSACSEPGNARSSRWYESCVSRLRGNA